MYLYAAVDCDESENVVAIDWPATACQLEVDSFEVLVNDEDVIVTLRPVLAVGFERELFGTTCSLAFEQVVLVTVSST